VHNDTKYHNVANNIKTTRTFRCAN